MTETEVTAAQSALDALPAAWVSPAFSATILTRAATVAAQRKLSALTAAAATAKTSALAAVIADPSDEAIATLVLARQTEAALSEASYVLPAPSLDLTACGQVVATAMASLASSAPPTPTVLDYTDEYQQWKAYTLSSRLGALVDPPTATDADRAAQVSYTEALRQVREWGSALALVRTLTPATTDVLGILDSAQSYCERAADIASVVTAANVLVEKANAARAEAGLNWSATS